MTSRNGANVGNMIRLDRAWRGISAKDLAERAGLSPAYLSRIEAGKANPSIDVLSRIADALGISLDALARNAVPGSERFPPPGGPRLRPTVVRKDARKTMRPAGSAIVYELLTPDLQRSLQFVLVRHEPGETVLTYSHQGEESMFCLEGLFCIRVGEEEFVLEAGDCISFDCSVPHSVRVVGEAPAVLLSAQVPPSF